MPDAVTPAENQPEPEIIEMEIAGAKFTGTKDEVLEKLAKSVEHGTMTIRAQKETTQQLTQLLEELKRPAPVATNGWDKDRYFKMLAEDPEQAADYLDEHRYGTTRQQRQEQWNRSLDAAETVLQLREVNRFAAAATDWPGTPEASETLLRHLQENGREPTAANMALAYGELRASGAIKPAEPREAEESEPRARRAPPSARGTGGSPSGGKAPEAMTLAELRAAIEKGGMARNA